MGFRLLSRIQLARCQERPMRANLGRDRQTFCVRHEGKNYRYPIRNQLFEERPTAVVLEYAHGLLCLVLAERQFSPMNPHAILKTCTKVENSLLQPGRLLSRPSAEASTNSFRRNAVVEVQAEEQRCPLAARIVTGFLQRTGSLHRRHRPSRLQGCTLPLPWQPLGSCRLNPFGRRHHPYRR